MSRITTSLLAAAAILVGTAAYAAANRHAGGAPRPVPTSLPRLHGGAGTPWTEDADPNEQSGANKPNADERSEAGEPSEANEPNADERSEAGEPSEANEPNADERSEAGEPSQAGQPSEANEQSEATEQSETRDADS